MHKQATVNARIEPALKVEAENILRDVGLTSAEAVRLFYKQICLQNGLPFDVRIPNETTLKAMRDAEAGKTHKADSIHDIFKDLG